MAPYEQTNLSWLLCRWMRKTVFREIFGDPNILFSICTTKGKRRNYLIAGTEYFLNIDLWVSQTKVIVWSKHVHWKNTPGFNNTSLNIRGHGQDYNKMWWFKWPESQLRISSLDIQYFLLSIIVFSLIVEVQNVVWRISINPASTIQ